MADKKKTDDLEMERIKLERYKVKGKIITVLISVVIGTFGVNYINHIIQSKRLEGQLKQQEMKYLGDFLANALVDDYEKRFRFADYFATLTSSPKLQEKWVAYRDKMAKTKKDFEHTQVLLAKAKEEKNIKKVEELTTKVMQQKVQLEALPDKSVEYLTKNTVTRLHLKKDLTPRTYTENEFELETFGNDKVIFDKETGLTWQQSGSEELMEYDKAKMYISRLNRDKFAEHNDWRLPTLKEAITLLEEEISDGLYINPIFDKEQKYVWTSDNDSDSLAWVVLFPSGECFYDLILHSAYYVRAVR